MPKAEWTPAAKRELDEIHDFIGVERRSQVAAEKIVRDLHAKAELYATQPTMGLPRPDLGAGFRVFRHKPYIVVATETEPPVNSERGCVSVSADLRLWSMSLARPRA